MTSDLAVRVEDLNKLYRIGTATESSDNLISALGKFARAPLRNYKKYRSLYDFKDVDFDAIRAGEATLGADLLWAVQNMTFDVPKGQILGVIGHNGAGKSTLLKILSRITAPTRGRVEIHGRMSSLLEVGTGFHQELTGRENVYLNGTILGMRKREVDREFDEIVAFSGVERFLDTPVKRYSSGMKVRLAFAVAAHLRPEILIIDEVLSVGDAEFQRKCMGKMEAIGDEGRTILFVSHNLPAVTRMCHRVLMVEQGKIIMDGSPHDVVSTYLRSGKGKTAEKSWADQSSAPGGDIARLSSISVRNAEGEIRNSLDIRQPVFVRIEFECLKPGHILTPTFSLWNDEGFQLFTSMDLDPEWRGKLRPTGRYVCEAQIPGDLLAEGTMAINTALWEWEPHRRLEYYEKEVVAFQVVDNLEGDSARGDYLGHIAGAMRPKLEWSTSFAAPEERVLGNG
jgi:lipopolysaccharide transport system ATP-binding protein